MEEEKEYNNLLKTETREDSHRYGQDKGDTFIEIEEIITITKKTYAKERLE